MLATLPRHEIIANAQKFVLDFAHITQEAKYDKQFWDGFFAVFGLNSNTYLDYQYRAPRASIPSGWGRADFFWAGYLLIEHKSANVKIAEGEAQGLEYYQGLLDEDKKNNTKYAPKYLVVCNFKQFRILDFTNNNKGKNPTDILLKDLPDRIDAFELFMKMGDYLATNERDVNLMAARKIGFLHQFLKEKKYTGKPLETLLTRLLFCFFAEDAGMFGVKQFQDLVEQNQHRFTAVLELLFIVLATPYEQRGTLPELNAIKKDTALYNQLVAFAYVNGNIFAERLPPLPLSLSEGLQHVTLDACYLNWFVISPAIFGTLFQSAMQATERREKGAHYTTQINILKALQPLFLDDLLHELQTITDTNTPVSPLQIERLVALHKRLCQLRFLDPACGCGNFLVVAYNQLRVIELRIFEHLNNALDDSKKAKHRNAFFAALPRIRTTQFYGVEYDEAAVHIARLALILAEHQYNCRMEQTMQLFTASLPLKETPNVTHANALTTDWQQLPDRPFDYIIGNPPFVGSKMMTVAQRNDLLPIFGAITGAGILDYVTAWYAKAAQYMQQHPATQTAFVSTNSVSQGEQVGVLWQLLLEDYNVHINFAHQTFKWTNEDTGVAAVHCVIIGFACFATNEKQLFEYANITEAPTVRNVRNINPYLVEGGNVFITKQSKPIVKGIPAMSFGNMPLDGGHLLLTPEEKQDLVKREPKVAPFIRPLISAHEYLNGKERFCLWLLDAQPEQLQKMPLVKKRIEAVRQFRLASVAPSTQKFADTPAFFRDKNNPDSFIVIPSTSSENRKYIPMGFFDGNTIASNSCHIIPNGDAYLFGQLMSVMHIAWVKYTCGRLKSDFRYSKDIVYNNYPFPSPTAAQRKAVSAAAEAVLAIRAKYVGASLAALYGATTMPQDLLLAHRNLDKAVDACYRREAFGTDAERVAYLFELYAKIK